MRRKKISRSLFHAIFATTNAHVRVVPNPNPGRQSSHHRATSHISNSWHWDMSYHCQHGIDFPSLSWRWVIGRVWDSPYILDLGPRSIQPMCIRRTSCFSSLLSCRNDQTTTLCCNDIFAGINWVLKGALTGRWLWARASGRVIPCILDPGKEILPRSYP